MAAQPPANSVWIAGPLITPNKYHRLTNATPKYMIIHEIKKSAHAGLLSKARIACIAQLLHDGIVLPIGDNHGCKKELKGISNAWGIVDNITQTNPDLMQPNNDDVNIDNLLAHQGMFKDEVPRSRKRLFDLRVVKFDFPTYIATWTFPNVPPGRCTLRVNDDGSESDDSESDDDGKRDGGFDYSLFKNYEDFNDKINLSQAQHDRALLSELDKVDPTVFVPSQYVSKVLDPVHENGFIKRHRQVLTARLQIMFNIQTARHADGTLPITEVLKYSDLKSDLNLFNNKFANLLMLYRVYHMCKPVPALFGPFLDKKGDELRKSHDILWKRCWLLLNNGPTIDKVIKNNGERAKAFPFDYIPAECDTLFKLDEKKLVPDNARLETFALLKLKNAPIDQMNDKDYVFDGLRPKAKRRKISHDVGGIVGIGSTALDSGDKSLLNNLVSMIQIQLEQRDQQRDAKLGAKLDNMNMRNGGSAFTDSISDMLKKDIRGTYYFCHNYAVGKDKECKGFELIGRETISNGVESRRRKTMQALLNRSYKGKDKILMLHGKQFCSCCILSFSRYFRLPLKLILMGNLFLVR